MHQRLHQGITLDPLGPSDLQVQLFWLRQKSMHPYFFCIIPWQHSLFVVSHFTFIIFSSIKKNYFFKGFPFCLFIQRKCIKMGNKDSVYVTKQHFTVCSYHVTYMFQSESTLYVCLNVKELLTLNRHKIWSLSDCNWTRTHNHLVHKQTLSH